MRKYSFAPIQVRPFPNIGDLNNKWIFGGVRCVINVSERESDELINEYAVRKIEYYHFPLKEKVEDMGWDNIVKAVRTVLEQIKRENPIIIHCEGGNNRSPLIAEASYYCIKNEHLDDEYKGYQNHLIYNCENHFLPISKAELEDELLKIRQEVMNQ